MKNTEMLELLREFYRDTLALRERHAAAAQHVREYGANNAYQYVIARKDVQVRWLYDAIKDLGGETDEVPQPELRLDGKGKEAAARLIAADAKMSRDLVEKWRNRVDALPNARHRSLLRVVLGETLEHQRLFEQASGGRMDVLGPRADGAGTPGEVLSTRWVE